MSFETSYLAIVQYWPNFKTNPHFCTDSHKNSQKNLKKSLTQIKEQWLKQISRKFQVLPPYLNELLWKSKLFVAFSNLFSHQQKIEFSNEVNDIFQFSSSNYFPVTFILFLLMSSNIFWRILFSRVETNTVWHFQIYSEISKYLCSPMKWQTFSDSAGLTKFQTI